MKIRICARTRMRRISYMPVLRCPLCSGEGTEIARLSRSVYRFGPLTVPLPTSGVTLRACETCDLLFKDAIPELSCLQSVLAEAAEEYWQTKSGPHPRAKDVQPYINGGSLLDIGASNGDLLRGVTGSRLSAFDAVPYEACQRAVTGEYIISPFEHTPAARWSGIPYTVVTAFDVFEHFMDTRAAILNLSGFLAPGGYLILETGNWRSVPDSGRWYYTNLFEHQIFWSRRSLAFLEHFGFQIERCAEGLHKSRLTWPPAKRVAVTAYNSLRLPLVRNLMARLTGVEPGILPPARLHDHIFAVLRSSGHDLASASM